MGSWISPPATRWDLAGNPTMDQWKVNERRAFDVKIYKQNPAALHAEELSFFRVWVER